MTGKHPSASTINQYVAGTLPLAEVATTEEHLLICLRCRIEAEDALDFRIMVRSALADVVAGGYGVTPAPLALSA